MDKKLIAAKQKHEMRYLLKKWAITPAELLEVVFMVGRSRKKVEAELKALGFKLRKELKAETPGEMLDRLNEV